MEHEQQSSGKEINVRLIMLIISLSLLLISVPGSLAIVALIGLLFSKLGIVFSEDMSLLLFEIFIFGFLFFFLYCLWKFINRPKVNVKTSMQPVSHWATWFFDKLILVAAILAGLMILTSLMVGLAVSGS